MKNLFTLYAALFMVSRLFAQNNPPIITNYSVLADTTLKKVTITYDVADIENDSLEITLRISNNGGQTYLVSTVPVTGNVGFPIFQGTNKQIIWNYSGLTGVAGNYKFRLIANDRHPVSIHQLVNQVDSMKLKSDMQKIQGIRNYATGASKLAEVKDTMFQRLQSLGLETYMQNFQYNTYQAQNIISKKQGYIQEDSILIIDGHYDSVSNAPGADDNGSAVIGVLEAARILSQYDFKKTIRFIGFDLEELGLLGSKEYVNNGIKQYEKVKGVLNFEMIGYYTNRKNSQTMPTGFNILFPTAYNKLVADTFRGNFITNVANATSSLLGSKFEAAAAMYVPALKVISLVTPGTIQDLRRSDHAAFWDAGMKALMLTDGADFRNHNYHTAHDVSDSLNFTFIYNVVKATIATVADLAQLIHSDSKMADVLISNIATSLNEKNKPNDKLSVIPNPGNEKVIVSWSEAGSDFNEILVLDISGKTIYKSKPDIGKRSHTLFIENFENGTYILRLSSQNKVLTEKLIIKH